MAGKKCTAKRKYEDEHRTFLVEQFKNLIAELDQGLPGDLPLHCTVRWLSKGKVLSRFFELLDAVKLFMEQKDKDYPELSDPKWIMDLAFLVDMLCHLDRLNLDLQGKLKMLPDLVQKLLRVATTEYKPDLRRIVQSKECQKSH
ncbi:hypothetical protein KUCAC02_017602 [Chaenocephalus aceratus]|uniref:Uncharacterized protein n=1 Tax=Chaenocephalus aceratus TaxID=36190 RepID=A0ACB9W2H7_CHAAC|nr:hypothetical protein KUCAC02_017602 [Chaenocephalus aceratus]